MVVDGGVAGGVAGGREGEGLRKGNWFRLSTLTIDSDYQLLLVLSTLTIDSYYRLLLSTLTSPPIIVGSD